MAQGEFTKQEAKVTLEAVNEMFEAIAKRKQGEYLGHLNDICLFIGAAARNAPDQPETKTPATPATPPA